MPTLCYSLAVSFPIAPPRIPDLTHIQKIKGIELEGVVHKLGASICTVLRLNMHTAPEVWIIYTYSTVLYLYVEQSIRAPCWCIIDQDVLISPTLATIYVGG